jgi:hypothetical protein
LGRSLERPFFEMKVNQIMEKMGFLRVERTNGKPAGLERTDNNMDLSSWPVVAPINQKNYYTYAASLLLPCHGNAPLLTLPDQ